MTDSDGTHSKPSSNVAAVSSVSTIRCVVLIRLTFATLVGGAKKHGEVNYTLGADIPYTIVDKSNPIMQGMSDITIFDEAFYNMTWAKDPAIHVLATAVIPGTPSAGDP